MNQAIKIPPKLLPQDGRFGSGPSKIRTEQLTYLLSKNKNYLGTSHRQTPVKNLVGELKAALAEYYNLPAGYEIVVGNGGSTAFWEIIAFCLIETYSTNLCYGEFTSKFAQVTADNPLIDNPKIFSSKPGTVPTFSLDDTTDLLGWAQNETSTGVMLDLPRQSTNKDVLMTVDATSAAGGLAIDLLQTDVYYFSPQKCFGADGGTWFAILSPHALERMKKIAASKRWIPNFFSLPLAVENSRKNQTYNTPSLATLALMQAQLTWFNQQGGMNWTEKRCQTSAKIIYDWAEKNDYTSPFVKSKQNQSKVVATIDFTDQIDTKELNSILRLNGILDTDSYRKLGRNQLRIALFPSIDPQDVQALTDCIDWVVSNI